MIQFLSLYFYEYVYNGEYNISNKEILYPNALNQTCSFRLVSFLDDDLRRVWDRTKHGGKIFCVVFVALDVVLAS